MQVQVEPARLLREFYETEIEISIYLRPQRECLGRQFWAGEPILKNPLDIFSRRSNYETQTLGIIKTKKIL